MFKQKVKCVNESKIHLSPDEKALFLKASIEQCERNIYDLSRKMLNKTIYTNDDTISVSDTRLLNDLKKELASLQKELQSLEK